MADRISKTQLLEGINSIKEAVAAIIRTLEKHDKAFEKIDHTLTKHDKSLSYLSGEVLSIKMELSYIKEDTAKIPELQRLLELTASANSVDRREHEFTSNRVSNHEERLTVVEDALSITPAEAVLL